MFSAFFFPSSRDDKKTAVPHYVMDWRAERLLRHVIVQVDRRPQSDHQRSQNDLFFTEKFRHVRISSYANFVTHTRLDDMFIATVTA